MSKEKNPGRRIGEKHFTKWKPQQIYTRGPNGNAVVVRFTEGGKGKAWIVDPSGAKIAELKKGDAVLQNGKKVPAYRILGFTKKSQFQKAGLDAYLQEWEREFKEEMRRPSR